MDDCGGNQMQSKSRHKAKHQFEDQIHARNHLHDGWVLRKRAGRLGRLTHRQVLDVAASEDDVLKSIISGRDGSVSGAVLRTKGTH